MENYDLELGDPENLIDALYRQGRIKVGPALRGFAAIQQRRAKDLRATEKRLKAELGEDNPKVIALGRAAAASEELRHTFVIEAKREAQRPDVGRKDWAVFGRVFDAMRKPASGLRVRLYDKDERYDELLGEAVTDEFGDFAFVYPENIYAAWLSGDGTDLYLLVQDAQQNALYTSQKSMRPVAGRVEYFEIVLGESPPAPGRSPAKSQSKGRKKKVEK